MHCITGSLAVHRHWSKREAGAGARVHSANGSELPVSVGLHQKENAGSAPSSSRQERGRGSRVLRWSAGRHVMAVSRQVPFVASRRRFRVAARRPWLMWKLSDHAMQPLVLYSLTRLSKRANVKRYDDGCCVGYLLGTWTRLMN